MAGENQGQKYDGGKSGAERGGMRQDDQRDPSRKDGGGVAEIDDADLEDDLDIDQGDDQARGRRDEADRDRRPENRGTDVEDNDEDVEVD
jgi:hypothetical protein